MFCCAETEPTIKAAESVKSSARAANLALETAGGKKAFPRRDADLFKWEAIEALRIAGRQRETVKRRFNSFLGNTISVQAGWDAGPRQLDLEDGPGFEVPPNDLPDEIAGLADNRN
jgi:hypothetical protein